LGNAVSYKIIFGAQGGKENEYFLGWFQNMTTLAGYMQKVVW